MASESIFARVVTGVFLAVGAVGVVHHEMWRDEMHAWLVARDGSSLWSVFQITRSEAHFVLWRAILYPLTRCTHNPMAMQFLSLLMAAGTVWIVARLSPFRRLEKVLFSFGYFTLYEYCIIAQDYTLTVNLMFCFCALYRRRVNSYLGLCVVLSLMANSVPYGLAIALVFTALLVFDWSFNRAGSNNRIVSKPNLRASGLILLGGYASAGLQLALMKETPSTTWKHALSWEGLTDTLANVWRAYVPIPVGFPSWSRSAWGSNVILDGTHQEKGIAALLALICVAMSVSIMFRKPSGLFLYIAGVSTLLSVQFVVNAGALRHTGFLFLLLLASLWIGDESGYRETSTGRPRRPGDLLSPWQRSFVVGLLVAHLVTGVDIFGADWLYPFSGSRPAAHFIRDHGLSDLVIVGAELKRIAPLSGYLDKQIYYPDISRFGSYIDYTKPVTIARTEGVIKEAWDLARQRHRAVVVVLSGPILAEDGKTQLTEARVCADHFPIPPSEPSTFACCRIAHLASFPSMIDEYYYIYLLSEE